jgi:hypothetical protein
MDEFGEHSPAATIVLVLTGLYLLCSFVFSWQQDCIAGICRGRLEWRGLGLIAGLLALALLVWEGIRVYREPVAAGPFDAVLVSLALALGLLLMTLVAFQDDSEARTWAPWAALILSILIAIAAAGEALTVRLARSRRRSEPPAG